MLMAIYINKLSVDKNSQQTVKIITMGTRLCIPFPPIGDLMVGMLNRGTAIIIWCIGCGQHVLTIQQNNTGHMLYRHPL